MTAELFLIHTSTCGTLMWCNGRYDNYDAENILTKAIRNRLVQRLHRANAESYRPLSSNQLQKHQF